MSSQFVKKYLSSCLPASLESLVLTPGIGREVNYGFLFSTVESFLQNRQTVTPRLERFCIVVPSDVMKEEQTWTEVTGQARVDIRLESLVAGSGIRFKFLVQEKPPAPVPRSYWQ